MAKLDMKPVGAGHAGLPFRVAASATRAYYGEAMIVAPTYTSGVSNVNTITVLTDGMPTIGTDQFLGILGKDMEVNAAGTVLAHRTVVFCPTPFLSRIRGKLKTASTGDTESEALGLMFDIYHIDVTSSVHTFEPASADTKGFVAQNYNAVKSTIDCIVDGRAMQRADIT